MSILLVVGCGCVCVYVRARACERERETQYPKDNNQQGFVARFKITTSCSVKLGGKTAM